MPRVVNPTQARITVSTRVILSILACVIFLLPLVWMLLTAFKPQRDVVTIPPKLTFSPSLEGIVSVFTARTLLSPAQLRREKARCDAGECSLFERVAVTRGERIIGASLFLDRLKNSVIIAIGSTVLAVVLGVFAAYAFSRFRIAGTADLQFFILSTRMLPPVVVAVPIFLMYRELNLYDTHLGMIILYTVFNLSLSVWLLKGFIDEIPREYEEAALIDGYSRWQAFRKIVLPQAVTGIAATTVFSMIFAWNEYAFALMLTSENARTAPIGIYTALGSSGKEWSSIAAGSLLFLIPVVIVTFTLRKYLLRGITFGAIRQ